MRAYELCNGEKCAKKLQEFGFIDESTICAINHFSHNGKYIYDELPQLVGDDGFVIAYDGLEVVF